MNYKNYIKNIAILLCLLVISIPIALAEEFNRVYDANGNLISDGKYYREYNGLNQLVKVRLGNISTSPILEEYKWHPIEERIVIKRVFSNGVYNYTVYYPNENYVYIVNSSGSYNEKYIYQDGVLVAQVNSDGQKQAIHSDHEGSNTLIIDSAGNVVENILYSPFGEILEGGKSSRYGYEGKEYDPLIEKIDFKFRDYDPKIMIFGKSDDRIQNVYDPQSLNRYMFERGNPYNYIDPDGHEIDIIADILFIGYDLYKLAVGGAGEDGENLVALKLDIAGAIIPFATGLGAASRAARVGGKSGDLIKTSQKVADTLGPAKTATEGTLKHREAATALRQSGLKDVYTEVSLKESTVVPHGTLGSTRVDAIQSSQDLSRVGTRVDSSQTRNVVDFKFGQTGMNADQAKRIQQQTGAKPTEIKPKTGSQPQQKQSLWSRIKSFFRKKK